MSDIIDRIDRNGFYSKGLEDNPCQQDAYETEAISSLLEKGDLVVDKPSDHPVRPPWKGEVVERIFAAWEGGDCSVFFRIRWEESGEDMGEGVYEREFVERMLLRLRD